MFEGCRGWCAVLGLYCGKIAGLSAALNPSGLKLEAAQLLRGLVSEVRMVRDRAAPSLHHIELVGDLACILALSAAHTKSPAGGGAFW